MLKRKISETLKKWKEQPNHFPLVIMGIRQCGKTYISQLFAEENYKHAECSSVKMKSMIPLQKIA